MCQYGCSLQIARRGSRCRLGVGCSSSSPAALHLIFERSPPFDRQHARPAAVARLADAQTIDLEIEQMRQPVAAIAAAVADAFDPVVEIERLVRVAVFT